MTKNERNEISLRWLSCNPPVARTTIEKAQNDISHLIGYIHYLENMPLVQTVVKLQEENERLTTALEVANDCLFGNTYGDKVLEEAYQVVSQALRKAGDVK